MSNSIPKVTHTHTHTDIDTFTNKHSQTGFGVLASREGETGKKSQSLAVTSTVDVNVHASECVSVCTNVSANLTSD